VSNLNVDRQKGCVICKYWQGDAGANLIPRTRIVRFDSKATGSCMAYGYKSKHADAGFGCPKFAKEYLYVQ
jgi:hypothetical protein